MSVPLRGITAATERKCSADRSYAEAAVAAGVHQMTADTDAKVRYQLAFTLGAFAGLTPGQALIRLAQRDGDDAWMRLAILSSVAQRRGEVFRLMLGDRPLRDSSPGRSLLGALAGQIGAAQRANELADFLQGIETLADKENKLSQDLVRQLATKLPPGKRDWLKESKTHAI